VSSGLWTRISRYKFIYLLIMPGFLYFVLFKYVPMWGLLLSFKDYNPFQGFWQSPWVGLEHFRVFFAKDDFWMLMRNTLMISLMNIVLFFPLPIALSILLNEVRREGFKRVIQSIVYLPHFMSWVVVASFTVLFFSMDVGLVNKALNALGYEPVAILTKPQYFWGMLTAQSIWKEVGWGTIIFLASIAGIDQQLYEAAIVDGAGRWKQIWHITLPSISGTIVILLILRMGNMLDVGFEQILLMLNSLVLPVGEVFDTYTYKQGILSGQFSYSTAVGLFKSLIGLVLVVGADRVAKKLGYGGLY
jgi:putative aldouronate transport system permease protein